MNENENATQNQSGPGLSLSNIYIILPLSVLGAFLVRLALQPYFGIKSQLLSFHLAVMVSAYYGGRTAGLIATALGGLVGWYFFVEPLNSFRIDEPGDALSLLLFVAVGAGISFLAGRLHDAERLKTSIINATLDCIVTSDEDGKVIEWNEPAERVFGYTRQQALGKDLAELIIPPSLREGHRRGMEHLKKTGEGPVLGKRLEMEAMRSDHSVFPCELVINRIPTRPYRYTGFIRDLSEQKKAEESLQTHTHVLEKMAEGVNISSEEGIIIYTNPAEDRMFGYDRGELIGKHVRMLNSYPTEDNDRIVQETIEHLTANGSWAGEFNNRRKDGTSFITSARITALELSGKIVWVCVHEDITERKGYEEERTALLGHERALRSDAERNSRMKDEFLATLSHELRTPLNSILGWSRVIRRRKADAEKLEQGLDIIERNAKSQAKMIEDLLDMNVIVSGKVKLDVQSVDLIEAIDDALKTVRLAAEAKEVKISKFLDTGTLDIKGDKHRIQQVLWNLLANSVKFTPQGGEIEIRVKHIDSHVNISVADTGEGIDAEFLPFVFDRFRQADASITRRHGGLGLGLSIVRSLVELHGGRVSAESEGRGKGSTFIVTFPVTTTYTEGEPVGTVPATETGTLQMQLVSLCGIRVMAVEDEPDARQLIVQILEESGAEVQAASSGKEGLELLSTFTPDVIISDIGMPEMDGYDFLRRVRELADAEQSKVPAIALTAFARSEDRLLALKAGYQLHISKPVDVSELTHTIANIVRRS